VAVEPPRVEAASVVHLRSDGLVSLRDVLTSPVGHVVFIENEFLKRVSRGIVIFKPYLLLESA